MLASYKSAQKNCQLCSNTVSCLRGINTKVAVIVDNVLCISVLVYGRGTKN